MHPSALKSAFNSYPLVWLFSISLLLWPAHKVWGGKAKAFAQQRIGRPSAYLDADSGLTLPEFQSEVKKFVGIPYRRGGAGPKGMDCSGFTQKVFLKLFGIALPHNSVEQSKLPSLVQVPTQDLQTGDLLFFGPKKKRINHVGIYLGGGKFIHAGRRAGVTIADLHTNYWRSRFIVSKRAEGLNWIAQSGEAPKSGQDFDMWTDSAESFGSSSAEHVWELGIGKSLFSNSLDISVAAFMHATLSSGTDFSNPAGLADDSEMLRTAAWQAENGFKASANFRATDWLNVMPSLKYQDSWDGEWDLRSGAFQIGLETWIVSPSARWLLYLSGWTDSADKLSVLADSLPVGLDALDISFGLGYRLTDSCRLSAMGTSLGNQDTSSNADARRGSPSLDSFSVKIDVNF
jgi:NlpC/P60 family